MEKDEDKLRLVVASRACRGPLVGRGTGGRVDKIALALVEDHVSVVTCHLNGDRGAVLCISVVSLQQQAHWPSKWRL